MIPDIIPNFAPRNNKTTTTMRIKHFAGYGCVNVKKLSKTKFTDRLGNIKRKLVLQVKGNHEWGLERDDKYDVKRWIFDRFENDFKGEAYDIQMEIEDKYVNENGVDVEVATYTFIY